MSDSVLGKAYDQWKAAEEAENRTWQRGGYASDTERKESEDAADAAYAAVVDTVYGQK